MMTFVGDVDTKNSLYCCSVQLLRVFANHLQTGILLVKRYNIADNRGIQTRSRLLEDTIKDIIIVNKYTTNETFLFHIRFIVQANIRLQATVELKQSKRRHKHTVSLPAQWMRLSLFNVQPLVKT